MTDEQPKPPAALNHFVHMVLSYRPKPKSKPAKQRKRRATKTQKEAQTHGSRDQRPGE